MMTTMQICFNLWLSVTARAVHAAVVPAAVLEVKHAHLVHALQGCWEVPAPAELIRVITGQHLDALTLSHLIERIHPAGLLCLHVRHLTIES